MSRRFQRFCLVLLIFSAVFGASIAAAKGDGGKGSEKPAGVTEDLLRTLHENGQLSDASFRRLLRHYRADQKASLDAVASSSDWEFKWKNGLRFSRRDGKHKLKISGHIQNDWAIVDYDDETARLIGIDDEDLHTGTEFRRARFAFSGRVYRRFGFKAQVDFSGGEPEFKSVWISIRKLGPLGTLTIGQFREPFSLEGVTGSKYTTFMERALPNALVPERGTGFQLANAPHKGRMTWALAILRQTNDTGRGFGGDAAYDVALRVTGLPVYEKGGSRLVHVGFSYAHQFRSGREEVRYRARPESNLSERFVSTRNIDTRGQDLFGFELATVLGPFSVQGEIMGSRVNDRAGQDPIFWGGYGMASLFLTGEHRVFDRDGGSFGRVEPIHDFNPKKGHCGAWELTARVSYLDLDSNGTRGGVLTDVTAGLNWYLTPNFRWMLNYVMSDLKSAGQTNIGEMRFQFDF